MRPRPRRTGGTVDGHDGDVAVAVVAETGYQGVSSQDLLSLRRADGTWEIVSTTVTDPGGDPPA